MDSERVRFNFYSNELFIILALLLLGTGLRFYHLDYQSLWSDELESWHQSNHETLSAVINDGVRPDVHPPAYQVLLYFVAQYFGDTEFVLRFPSAVFGVFSIFLMFLLGRRCYSSREATVATGLFVVLWCPIYFSQEVRSYSLLLFLTLASTLFFLALMRALNQSDSKVSVYTVLGYIFSSVLAVYTHYYGILLVVLQGIYLLIYCVRVRKGCILWCTIYASIILFYIPWIPMVWEDLQIKNSWVPRPNMDAYIIFMRFLFNWSKPIVWVAQGLYLYLLIYEIARYLKSKKEQVQCKNSSTSLFLFLWFLVPFCIVFIKSITSTPIFVDRCLIISLPPAYLLIARSMCCLPLKKITMNCVSVIVVGFMLYHLIFVMDYYVRPMKTQFREAVTHVVELDKRLSDTLIIGYAINTEFFDYYFYSNNYNKRVLEKVGLASDIPRTAELFQQTRPRFVWYLVGHIRPEPAFMEYLNQNLILIEFKPFASGAGVFLYKVAENHAVPLMQNDVQ